MTTRTDDSYSRPIESRDDLLSVFAGGEKPRERWRIGTEHEKFVYRMSDHLAALLDGAPAVLGQAEQKVADPTRLRVAGSTVVGHAIDELLVLGADAPVIARLLPGREDRQEVVAALDRPGIAILGSGCHRKRARSDGAKRAPAPSVLWLG